jgi:hypothetical protein
MVLLRALNPALSLATDSSCGTGVLVERLRSPGILLSSASVTWIEIEGTLPVSCLSGKLSRER